MRRGRLGGELLLGLRRYEVLLPAMNLKIGG